MLSLFQVFFEHLERVNGDEFAPAACQNLALLVPKLGDIYMLAPANILLAAFYYQRFPKWHWLQILNLHFPGQSDDVTEFIHLPHRLIENRCDNPSMCMSRRPDVARRQLEAADESVARLVEREFQLQPVGIIRPATETVVTGNLVVAGVVSGGGAFRSHILNMPQMSAGVRRMQTFAHTKNAVPAACTAGSRGAKGPYECQNGSEL